MVLWLVSLRQVQKKIHERLDHLEGRMVHMEAHVHEAFHPHPPLGNGPNDLALGNLVY